MLFVSNKNITDPSLNLALEEYCLFNLGRRSECLLLYVNDPSVIIGRNQNPFEETDFGFVSHAGIPVVRRVSGGGAVYHDRGNLNFSFVSRASRDRVGFYRHLTRPVRDTLLALGVPAEWNARNDIVANGRKISGNAQYVSSNRMLSHGTLLFNADLKALSTALAGTLAPLASKGLKSVRAEVANISDFLSASLSLEAFSRRILEAVAGANGDVDDYRLSDAEWQAVRELADRKYRTWDWNIGKTPEFVFRTLLPIQTGEVSAELRVNRGVIRNVTVTDNGGVGKALKQVVEGCAFEIDALSHRLSRLGAVFSDTRQAVEAAGRIVGLNAKTVGSILQQR